MPLAIMLTLAAMAAAGFFHYRNGLFSALTILFQVVIAGIVTFYFWEPLADILDGSMQTSRMRGYEDAIVLATLFTVTMVVLRLITNRINPAMVDFHPGLQQIGAAATGAFTGYLVSGFLVCVLQTLPVPADFLGVDMRTESEPGFRRYLPADRVWLSLMRHAGAYSLRGREMQPNGETNYDRFNTFDPQGTFELRYYRYRRLIGNSRSPMPYNGEFDQELYRGPFKK